VRRINYPNGDIFGTTGYMAPDFFFNDTATTEIYTEEVRELRVYLDDAMVDLDKPVTITVNGRKLHDATVKRSMDVMIEEAHKRRDTGMIFSTFVDLKIK